MMLEREDGVKNRQAKRNRDKIDRRGRVIRRIQSSGRVLANVEYDVNSRASRHGRARQENGILRRSIEGRTDRKEFEKANEEFSVEGMSGTIVAIQTGHEKHQDQ